MEGQYTSRDEQIAQVKEYAIYSIDVNGVIKTWNAGVGHLLGCSEDEWIDQHTSVIFSPADQAVTLG